MVSGILIAALVAACEPAERAERPGEPDVVTAPGTPGTTPGTTVTQAAVFDQQFIDHVVPHYQYGVDLAQVGKNNATHEELKTWSDNAANTWKAEVDRFKDWRKQWFGSGDTPSVDDMPALTGVAPYDFRNVWTSGTTMGTPATGMGAPATGMGATGTGTGTTDRDLGVTPGTTDRVVTPDATATRDRDATVVRPGGERDRVDLNVENTPKGQLEALRSLDKDNFDRAYVDTLLAYEQHSVTALRVAQSKATHPELKSHAGMLLDQHQRNVAQLEDWKNAWFGTDATRPAVGTD
ncbi:MAG: DUF305 domain-containing protein [Myxococcota bacterium]